MSLLPKCVANHPTSALYQPELEQSPGKDPDDCEETITHTASTLQPERLCFDIFGNANDQDHCTRNMLNMSDESRCLQFDIGSDTAESDSACGDDDADDELTTCLALISSSIELQVKTLRYD